MTKILEMPEDAFLRLLGEMEQDPTGYGKMDVAAVLRRVGYDCHTYNGFELHLREGRRAFHLRTTQNELPVDLVRMIANEALAILKENNK